MYKWSHSVVSCHVCYHSSQLLGVCVIRPVGFISMVELDSFIYTEVCILLLCIYSLMVYKMLNLPCATVLSVYMQCNTDPCHGLMGVSIIALILQAEAWRGPAQDHTTGKWMEDEVSSELSFI